MRTPRIITLGAVAALLAATLLPTGCEGPASTRPGGLRLRATPAPLDPNQPRLYVVNVVRLRHRLRPDAPAEDVWRLLGTASISHQKRALWAANDLRIGEGGDLAARRLNELVVQTADRTARTSRLVVRENMDFVVELGERRPRLDLVWTDAEGRLAGRSFTAASARFRFVCRRDPDDPDRVRLATVPEVSFGRPRLRYERTETGFTQRVAPEEFPVPDLAAEVTLAPGRLLVVGAAPDAAPVSVGGAFFFERRGPDRWQETLLLSVAPVAPGERPPAPREGPAAAPPASPSTGPSPSTTPPRAPSLTSGASAPAAAAPRTAAPRPTPTPSPARPADGRPRPAAG